MATHVTPPRGEHRHRHRNTEYTSARITFRDAIVVTFRQRRRNRVLQLSRCQADRRDLPPAMSGSPWRSQEIPRLWTMVLLNNRRGRSNRTLKPKAIKTQKALRPTNSNKIRGVIVAERAS